ncbi:MAG: hypothetical protein HYV63_05105 [Candidatus Schekmanbacteria bacterium]|nr:hypothetical protein [Candidatus Schekmanbacteria bacterium]
MSIRSGSTAAHVSVEAVVAAPLLVAAMGLMDGSALLVSLTAGIGVYAGGRIVRRVAAWRRLARGVTVERRLVPARLQAAGRARARLIVAVPCAGATAASRARQLRARSRLVVDCLQRNVRSCDQVDPPVDLGSQLLFQVILATTRDNGDRVAARLRGPLRSCVPGTELI